MRRRAALIVGYLLFLGLLVEGAARALLWIGLGAPLSRPSAAMYAFYPELRPLAQTPIRREDDGIDVLLLGGSVLDPRFGSIAQLLDERLTSSTGRDTRIHNLAMQAHTSRDSYLKFKWLEDKSFDAVVFYHGINEARANNVPPERFDLEYDHFPWYASVNAFDRDPWKRVLALPHAARRAGIALRLRVRPGENLTLHQPPAAWVAYGAELKSPASFRANLEAILSLARERGDPVLLMTFVHHHPPGYSEAGFARRELDYTGHRTPTELWGAPENVVAAIDAHNEVVREVAAKQRGTSFVDQARSFPRRREYFDDICHLTGPGAEVFVDAMLPALLELVAAAKRDGT